MTKKRNRPLGIRIYGRLSEEANSGVPAWRFVEFWKVVYNERYLVAKFVYPTLEQANNARIIARAFTAFTRIANIENKRASWANFARHLNYMHYPADGKRRESLGDAVSSKIYGNVVRGTLPKDERVRQMLIDLSGWPWE